MKLPNAAKAVVDRKKIVDYLLNRAHPDNGGKAEFFLGLGFKRKDWNTLAKALRSLAQTSEVLRHSESPHGRKYVIVGHVACPGGKTARVQTIWIVDHGSDVARLVTAYPRR